jgi:hypothetical protein
MEKRNKILINQLIFFLFLLIISSNSQIINISNCSSLQNMTTNNSTLIYQLTQNIDCNNINFIPIGSSTFPFSGIFDGINFTINNIYIFANYSNTGLFGYAFNATIRNINLYNITIISSGCSGFFLGSGDQSIIQNCHLLGNSSTINTLLSSNNSVGGIVGKFLCSNITNCSVSYFLLNGTNPCARGFGGIIGEANNCFITNCQNYGTDNSSVIIFAERTVGGIVGAACNCSIVQCGITQGVVIASSHIVGGKHKKYFIMDLLTIFKNRNCRIFIELCVALPTLCKTTSFSYC